MEEENGNRIIRINLLQVSMTLGTYLGVYLILAYAFIALTVKHTVMSLVALPLMLGIPVVAYLLVKRFRDQSQAPYFPFPISWIISILTFVFATALSCMVVYLYLRYVDKGTIATNMMSVLDAYTRSTQASISAMTDPEEIAQYTKALEMMRQNITMVCSLTPSGFTKQLISSSLMWGNILSVIIALITAKRIRIN
ncbi:MAG: DUF4199 domain-containing protein [Bacteroidaceae bacterium]|nr:DUF4199 domain-containing protein [Bacteroidaceae bacterium]